MISEILENHLYIGTIWDATHAKPDDFELIICVAEWDNFSYDERNDLFCSNRSILYCPIMNYTKSDEDLQNCEVYISKLDIICKLINKCSKVLLTCAAGVERSPLVAMWYLRHYCHGIRTLDLAYNYVKVRRPIIENRLNWIPIESRD